jgi:hypothetical protein
MRSRLQNCGALLAATFVGSCSPYYSFLPKALTYDMQDLHRADAAQPDPVLIASKNLRTILPSDVDPQSVSVGPPRSTRRGWSFCLKAIVLSSNAGKREAVFWITVLIDGIYDRRLAERTDQCELEQYTPVPAT